jgi:hypothetical protein
MVRAFHFCRDRALYFPHLERNPEHRLSGFMPSNEALTEGAIEEMVGLVAHGEIMAVASTHETKAAAIDTFLDRGNP